MIRVVMNILLDELVMSVAGEGQRVGLGPFDVNGSLVCLCLEKGPTSAFNVRG